MGLHGLVILMMGLNSLMGNEKNEPLRETGLSEDPWMITASEKYLYVLIERRALKYYLLKYDYSAQKEGRI